MNSLYRTVLYSEDGPIETIYVGPSLKMAKSEGRRWEASHPGNDELWPIVQVAVWVWTRVTNDCKEV